MNEVWIDDTEMSKLRNEMVTTQVEARGISDPVVLSALRIVPRHLFFPEARHLLAYEDGAFSIGEGQTISQPYIVGLMTALIAPKPEMRVLEIGTGSGYQAAVLAQCVSEVDTIENHPTLARTAETRLKALGITNVHVKTGDGFDGWLDRAPFDAIVVTAAPRRIPQPLLDQLKVGGRLVAPVGKTGKGLGQQLVVMIRTDRGWSTETVGMVMFVPMTGKAEKK